MNAVQLSPLLLAATIVGVFVCRPLAIAAGSALIVCGYAIYFEETA